MVILNCPTPGLFCHKTRPIWFIRVVDDFEIKYVGKDHDDCLLIILNEFYNVKEDWKVLLYCSIKLDWYYNKHQWVS